MIGSWAPHRVIKSRLELSKANLSSESRCSHGLRTTARSDLETQVSRWISHI